MPWCRHQGDSLVLQLRVQPRAARDEVVGIQGDWLKVRVTAPPVEGAANANLRRLLAAELGVSPSQVAVVAGHGGRRKRVQVAGPWLRAAWLPDECAWDARRSP